MARTIERDDFEEWKAHPITEAFMTLCAVKAEAAKAFWVQASWDGGQVDERLRAELKGQAALLADIQELTAEQLQEGLEEVE